jgi:hypothetical protein
VLHLFDLRDGHSLGESPCPQQSHFPHSDFVSSLSPLPPSDESTSGQSKQWLSTGDTTLAVTDLRRGVLVRSDDQEDELLASAFVPGLGPKKNRNNGVVAVASGTGVLTLWDRGSWDDQTDRIIVDRAGESLDCLVQIPESLAAGRKKVAVGVGDGTIRIVDLQRREVECSPLRHDDVEAVAALGFDCHGRMISAGGQVIKVWEEGLPGGANGRFDGGSDNSDDGGSDGDPDGDPDGDSDGGGASTARNGKHRAGSDDSDDSDSDAESRKRGKKKRRKGKGTAHLGPHGAHGILKFRDLD